LKQKRPEKTSYAKRHDNARLHVAKPVKETLEALGNVRRETGKETGKRKNFFDFNTISLIQTLLFEIK